MVPESAGHPPVQVPEVQAIPSPLGHRNGYVPWSRGTPGAGRALRHPIAEAAPVEEETRHAVSGDTPGCLLDRAERQDHGPVRGIWPVSHEGVTYNSYLLRDEKNVIIDLAKGFKTDEYFERIDALVPLSEIDYIVVNHMEPDHTGAIRALIRIPRKLTILATEKAREMLAAFYGITENIRVVADGEELSIGKRTLKFVHAPFVHWPETMVTYDVTDRILFSCDAFGGYGALPGTIFDDQCSDLRVLRAGSACATT